MTTPAAGLGLVVGLVTVLWSASSYVSAFGSAMNKIYDVPEGRPGVKLTVSNYLLTAFLLLLAAVAVFTLVMSGPFAHVMFDRMGIGNTGLNIWGAVKWLILGFVVVLVTALLYYATPNVKQPKFRWMSTGAFIAIIITAAASGGFVFYVSNFGNYDETYGSLAGIIIFLLWLYITNAILLFGGVLDSEIERARELQAGLAAEWEIQLPVRGKEAYDKQVKKDDEEAEKARALRLSEGRTSKIAEADTAVLDS